MGLEKGEGGTKCSSDHLHCRSTYILISKLLTMLYLPFLYIKIFSFNQYCSFWEFKSLIGIFLILFSHLLKILMLHHIRFSTTFTQSPYPRRVSHPLLSILFLCCCHLGFLSWHYSYHPNPLNPSFTAPRVQPGGHNSAHATSHEVVPHKSHPLREPAPNNMHTVPISEETQYLRLEYIK